MSKLEELIQQYCPDGVEHKKMGDVCKLVRGTRVVKKDLDPNGTYPVYQNSLKPLGYYDQYNRSEETTFIICAGAAGDIGYSKVKFWSADDCFSVICPETVSNRYIFYCLLSQQNRIYSQVRKASIPRLSHSAVEALHIPVPPLPVQEEIVRILDTFTELQAELQAELQKRLQQYNYYRDNLLSFEGRTDVEWKKLGNMCSIKARIGWQRLNKSEYLTTGDYYLITGVDIRGTRVDFQSCYYVSKERYDMDTNIQLRNGDIILTKDGTIGKVALIENMDKPGVLNSHLFVIRDTSGCILAKYLMYILLSKHFQSFVDKNKTQGTIPGLNQATVVKFELPIPSLEEQERIVAILDRFDKLTNDITAGLPAEIEARRKQYEYYRDQLLTFKKKA